MMTLKVDLPPDIPEDEARLLLTVKLFETGKVSLGKAADIAGYSKRDYLQALNKLGVSIFNYTAEELREESGI
jgi:predicted HTH domain antitoxin